MYLAIPTLETERLTLRPLREADATALFELSQDPDLVRYVGDRRVRASGQFIGRAGIINPAEWPGPEVGYLLGRAWWGRGYATEAARAAMDWGFREIGFDDLLSLIDPNNRASIGVATRLGESLRGEDEVMGNRVLLYGISRVEWEASRG